MSHKLNKPYTTNQRNDFIVEYSHNQGLIIEEIEKALYALEAWELLEGDEVIDNTEAWEAEQAQKEKERIQELKMSKSDFFDGTIDAWGINEDALLPLIQSMLAPLPLDEKQKLKAINNFKNAQNFYRKHDLFKMIVNIPLQLTESIQVIITDEHLDKFFDEVDKGNKDTAWQYLPQPVMLPIEDNTEVGETA